VTAHTRPVLISTALEPPAGVPTLAPYPWALRVAIWLGIVVVPWAILGSTAWLLLR
jgi:hypothetical protein